MDLDTVRRWWNELSEKQRQFVLATLNVTGVVDSKRVSDRFVFGAYRAKHWPTQDGWPK